VPAGDDRGGEARSHSRIGIEEEHQRCTCSGKATVPRSAHTTLWFMQELHSQRGVLLLKLLNDFRCSIRRAIINDDDLEPLQRPGLRRY